MIQEKAARKKKQIPPLKRVHAGVQMRLTMGQMPVKCRMSPARTRSDASDQETLDGDPGSIVAEPLPGAQPKQHGAEGGNEAERQIAAAIVDETRGAREQIEEPNVEGLAEVAVLVPMRGEAGEVVMPVRRHSYCGIVEVRAGSRVERPREPVADKERGQRGPLPLGRQ